jgi:AcrR family transcriptional regulator
VPKQVDHDARRRQIAEAVWRLAERAGLEQVTLRQVAAEAGVSMRLVQYYFGTRHRLLVGALEILNATAAARAEQRVGAAAGEPAPREVLRGVLAELLPLDDDRRSHYLVHVAYFVRSLADAELAAVFRAGEPGVETVVAELIGWGQRTGAVAADVDPWTEAELLVSAVEGMQAPLVLGQRTAERTLALLDHQLDRLFAAG